MAKIELIEKIESECIDLIKNFVGSLYSNQENFKEIVKNMLEECFIHLENENLLKNAKYITISQNLISFWADKKINYIIKAYDSSFIIGDEIFLQSISLDEIFQIYLELFELKSIDIKKYVGKISKFHIKEIFMNNVSVLNEFLIYVIFYSLREINIPPTINTIFIGKDCNELSLDFEQIPIYVNDIFENNIEEFHKILKERDFKKLSFRTYEKFDFSYIKENFSFKLFVMTVFKNCVFHSLNMMNSVVIQSEFDDCIMNNMDFSAACLDGTIFKNCQLQNCKFIDLKIMSDYKKYYIDFSCSNLKNTVISKELKKHILLSTEQEKNILWI